MSPGAIRLKKARALSSEDQQANISVSLLQGDDIIRTPKNRDDSSMNKGMRSCSCVGRLFLPNIHILESVQRLSIYTP